MRKLISAIFIAVLFDLVAASTAFALANPDSLSIVSVKVFHNNVETGDMTIIFEYDINYSTLPTTPPASTSFMFRLYSTDGATLLSSQVPYVLFNAGYGKGCGSFYFSATAAPTWGAAYIINISGSPAVFTTLPTPYNYTIQTSDYSTVTTQSDNQLLAANYVLNTIASDLMTAYPGLSLKGSTDTGEVLSGDGEIYFRGAIPGLNSIAPSLFFSQRYVPETMTLTYDQSKGAAYATRLANSDLMNGFTRLGVKMGTSGQTTACIIAILISIALVIFTAYKGWGVDPGLIGADIILTAAAVLLGDAVFTVRLIAGLLVAFILFFQLYLKRA